MGKNEYYLKQIGARIIECRKEKGYQNREDFAELLGISPNTLRNYENGVREIGTELLLKISTLLGVSTDRLLCKDKNTFSVPNGEEKELTPKEQEHIKKYRALDEPGKETVDYILDKELSRTKALEAAQKVVQLPEPQKPVEYVKLDIASRGGGIETRLVPKEDVEKAIELSRKYRDENKD